MSIVNSLLGLPTFLLMFLLILFFAGINIVVTGLSHRFLLGKTQEEKTNEITGVIFSVVTGFYALLLSFVVFQALDKYNNVQKDADTEASSAKSLYRQIKHYPDTAVVSALKKEFMNYAKLVVTEEYPYMENKKQSELTLNSFEKVFEIIEKLNHTNDSIKLKAPSMVLSVVELSKYRSLRILAGKVEISNSMWITLLIGSLIIAILASLLNIKNHRYKLFLFGLMGAFIGLIIFLIITLDHPFAGSIKIKPSGYETILKMEGADVFNK
jgi:ABC-type multidrug transport system fused ATPase/permease subunit